MSASTGFLHRRPRVAQGYAEALLGTGPFNSTSGLFLAAPRRTGKSTFMREDLAPELTSRDITTTYVDLWSNRAADPGELIVEALRNTLKGLENPAGKALRSTGLNRIGVLGASIGFNLDQLGTGKGATLTDAFLHIVRKTGKPTAMIVDEAQHALTTPAGENAMFALKAARDALNQGSPVPGLEGPGLLLVFTGSHRDKLANLVLKRDQPFFGADVVDFPRLGRDYTDAYTDWLNARLSQGFQFDKQAVFEAFKLLGSRPEMLQQALKDAAFAGAEKSSPEILLEQVRNLRDRIWADYQRAFDSLTPLQGAVLGMLIRKGSEVSPYAAPTLQALEQEVGKSVTAADVQSALESLRAKDIVWKSARASYLLEDQEMAEWYRSR